MIIQNANIFIQKSSDSREIIKITFIQFKVRQYPGGHQEALRKVISLIEAEEWEKQVEGLEILNSLALNSPEVLCIKKKYFKLQKARNLH